MKARGREEGREGGREGDSNAAGMCKRFILPSLPPSLPPSLLQRSLMMLAAACAPGLTGSSPSTRLPSLPPPLPPPLPCPPPLPPRNNATPLPLSLPRPRPLPPLLPVSGCWRRSFSLRASSCLWRQPPPILIWTSPAWWRNTGRSILFCSHSFSFSTLIEMSSVFEQAAVSGGSLAHLNLDVTSLVEEHR